MKIFRYILLSVLLAFAENSLAEQVDALILKLNNGLEEVYILSDRPVLTMPEDNVVVENKDLTSTYKRSEVKMFYFKKVDEEVSSIETVGENVVSYKFIDNNSFFISGLPTGTVVKIFSINGSLSLSQACDESGSVCLPLHSLSNGVFVISFAGRSIKIKR